MKPSAKYVQLGRLVHGCEWHVDTHRFVNTVGKLRGGMAYLLGLPPHGHSTFHLEVIISLQSLHTTLRGSRISLVCFYVRTTTEARRFLPYENMLKHRSASR